MGAEATRRAVLNAAAAGALGAGALSLLSAEPASADTAAPAPLNVYDYGAVGSGRHDDTSAFRAAIAALPPSGGSIYAPRGIFLLQTVTISKSNVTLFGDGESTILAKASSSPPLTISGSAITLSSFRIVDMNHGGCALQATAASTSGDCLRIRDLTYRADSSDAQGLLIKDYSDLQIEGCVLEGLNVTSAQRGEAYAGISLSSSGALGSPGAARVLIRNNIVRGFSFGIASGSAAETTRLMVEGNHIEGAAIYGVYLLHTPRVRVVANNIRNCNWGIWYDVGQDDGLGTSRAGEGAVFVGNQVSFCRLIGIGLGIARCVTVTGNTTIACGDGIVLGDASDMVTVSGNTSYGNSDNGLVVDRNLVGQHVAAVYDCTITGNTIVENGQHGIVVRGSQGTLVIAANTINSNGRAAANSYSGIRIATDESGTTNSIVKVSGNVIANTTDILGHGQQAYGVSVEAEAIRRLLITDNYFSANSAYSVYAPSPLGSGQTITVAGNFADSVGYALPDAGLELGLNFGRTDGLPGFQEVGGSPAVTGYVPVHIDGITYKLATIA